MGINKNIIKDDFALYYKYLSILTDNKSYRISNSDTDLQVPFLV